MSLYAVISESGNIIEISSVVFPTRIYFFATDTKNEDGLSLVITRGFNI